ncbi:hypothetical protein HK102_006368 [Quaeritorhiza haematococci]|nr:hypothetical protein HK102_006368 [Quaeritorhiza haematococci]
MPLGSDFPIEGVNPLLGIYAAVTRKDVEGKSPHGDGGWFPEERLTLMEALRGFTIDAAYGAFMEDQLGSITPTKLADFVVFDRDFMKGWNSSEGVPRTREDEEGIVKARVVATVVGGEVVYGGL